MKCPQCRGEMSVLYDDEDGRFHGDGPFLAYDCGRGYGCKYVSISEREPLAEKWEAVSESLMAARRDYVHAMKKILDEAGWLHPCP